MKLKYLAMILLGTSLLGVGCSKENEPEKKNESETDPVSISRISVSAEANDEKAGNGRTVFDGYSVNWNTGDALGCMKTTAPSSNNKFTLTAGAGTMYGTFDAASEADNLTEGTWIAYYPHNAVKYTSTNKFRVVGQTQSDGTPKHLALYDWLVSNPVTLSKSLVDSKFVMKHAFALVEFKVKLKNPADDYVEFAQCVLETQDKSTVFAQNVYFDVQGAIQFDYTARNASVSRLPYPEFTTDNTTCWLLVRQSELKDLNVRVYFTYQNIISSASVQFTPKSILQPGKKYVLELEMDIDEHNPNSSSLIILRRS